MKVKASLCVFASLFLTFSGAELAGNWPPLDQPPPPVAKWTALVDQAKVPNAPLVKTVGQCADKDTFCNWSCTGCTRPDSDVTKCPEKTDWGLTFDDGPTEFTNTLLDFLETKNAKVTFFVIGSRVVENPEILQKAVNAGHQIAIHTWSHPALTTQSNEQIIAELKWTEAAIKAAVGITPKYMRPPFGDYDDRVRGIATQLGYKIVIWDEDTNDWMSADDKTFQLTWIEGNFTQWVKQPSTTGHISLEHDLYKQTAERAQLAVPIVQGAGFTIKPVAVCTNEQPYLENISLTGSAAGPAAGKAGKAPAAAPAAGKAAGKAPAAAPPAAAPAAYPSPAADPAYPPPASAPTSAYPYLVGDAQSSPSATPATTNGASLNTISLWSFVSLIVGSFMFI
ncbi:Carbohydrate Esterase Family 4 protein [Glomus cerebriforme]|uniref:chitin deacetylase n=1 Tax=Glomus cerebriforme TaxID=658196 RepID=A0A397SI46_9GLOM|nr:Carbohydrate Esterase Family 4 protein [Glomus cerebriforme]